MTREEYLQALGNALNGYDSGIKADIMSEFESHFSEARAEGLDDEEIISMLGSVEEVAESMMEMYEASKEPNEQYEKKYQSQSSGETHLIPVDVDTIVIDGNLEVTLMPGVGNGYWEYKPSRAIELGFSLWGNRRINREAFDISFETVGKTVRYGLPKGFGTLKIEVPPGVRSIFVENKSGDLKVMDLGLVEFSGRSLSGDCDMRNCTIESADVSTMSGDIDIEDVFGRIRVNCASGDIDIFNHQGPELLAESISGDVTVSTTSPVAEASSKSGDIELTMSGALAHAKAESISGDVRFSSASKDYTARIHTVSGDINNRTALSAYKEGHGRQSVGNGPTIINLSSVSGDITIE